MYEYGEISCSCVPGFPSFEAHGTLEEFDILIGHLEGLFDASAERDRCPGLPKDTHFVSPSVLQKEPAGLCWKISICFRP